LENLSRKLTAGEKFVEQSKQIPKARNPEWNEIIGTNAGKERIL
jgi:hypothetical protein